MVFYFKSRCGEYTIYMGKDQFENDRLIKYGLPEDVWFHVDDLSSAHVYLRQKKGQTLNDITPDLLLDCCSLVKANSIKGSKMASVPVVYTRWKNLKKISDVPGQVGFHRPQNKRTILTEKNKPIVNALNRTKTEVADPDLEGQQQEREREAIADRKAQRRQEVAEERAKEKKREQRRFEAKLEREQRERDIAETIQKTQQLNLQDSDDDSSSSYSSGGDGDDLLGF